ncbi:MAG: rod shape-determining protein MreC [Clostridia bacterium]|nr:rod shape-determining protein MreC [Clostridia bacterium]
MRGFFRGNAFKLMLILVVILAAVTILSITTGDSVISGFFQGIISPMKSAVNDVIDAPSDNLGLKEMSRSELEAFATELAEENAELRQNLADYYDVKQKNEMYAEAIGILNASPDTQLLAASVISRDPTDIFYSFTLDVGSLDGVSLGDPVITSQGVVGTVSEIYSSSCRVMTLLNDDLKLGGVCEQFNENGIVMSDSSSPETGLIVMRYLDKNTQITKDSLITTSGTGGLFPKGLVIGKVTYLAPSDRDVSLNAVIRPAANIQNISDCFIITDFDRKLGVDGVKIAESNEAYTDN